MPHSGITPTYRGYNMSNDGSRVIVAGVGDPGLTFEPAAPQPASAMPAAPSFSDSTISCRLRRCTAEILNRVQRQNKNLNCLDSGKLRFLRYLLFVRFKMARSDDILLTDEELRRRRRKRRRLVVIAVALVLAGVAAFFGARPARDEIKAWQARRHAQRAFASIDKERWEDARTEALAAYRLRQTEPQAVR